VIRNGWQNYRYTMGIEIERKFLVKAYSYRNLADAVQYRQGYLIDRIDSIVRVRTIRDQGFLTIKGRTIGATRLEYEYEIPVGDAIEILNELCKKPIIEKHRYKIPFAGFIWEVDEFHRDNEGLIVAEIELDNENQEFERPDWVGEEVTGDQRYFNSNLIQFPYNKW